MKNYNLATVDGVSYAFSYNVPIARFGKNGLEINKKYYKYSKTTSRHLSKFIGSDSKEIEKTIKKRPEILVEFEVD